MLKTSGQFLKWSILCLPFCFLWYHFWKKKGIPDGSAGKGPACRCRRCKRRAFNPWAGQISWRRAWQLTPVFLLGESHRQRSLVGSSHTESDSSTALKNTLPWGWNGTLLMPATCCRLLMNCYEETSISRVVFFCIISERNTILKNTLSSGWSGYFWMPAPL